MKRSAWRYLWKSEDIRKKLLITLALLVLYRLAANIPVPGINREVIQQPGTGEQPRFGVTWYVGPAVRRYDVELLDPGNGRVSLHYCPDYSAAADPDHSCARSTHEGRSATGTAVDGEMDDHPDHPDGTAFGDWSDQYLQPDGRGASTDQLWLHWRDTGAFNHHARHNGGRYNVGCLAGPA